MSISDADKALLAQATGIPTTSDVLVIKAAKAVGGLSEKVLIDRGCIPPEHVRGVAQMAMSGAQGAVAPPTNVDATDPNAGEPEDEGEPAPVLPASEVAMSSSSPETDTPTQPDAKPEDDTTDPLPLEELPKDVPAEEKKPGLLSRAASAVTSSKTKASDKTSKKAKAKKTASRSK